MKKNVRLSLTALLLVLSLVWLTACGEGDKSNNTPDASPAVEQGEQEQPEGNTNEDEASATDDSEAVTGAGGTTTQAEKDLFVAVVGEANNLNSFTIEMTADQKLDMGGQSMDTVTTSTMDVTVKPEMAFKQLTQVEAEGMSQVIESYFTPEGFFLKDPETGSWMKLPQDMMDMVMQGANQDALDPSAQLKDLIDYTDELTVVEKDGIYTFTLSATGEAFAELIEKQLEQMQLAFPMDDSGLSINRIEYVIQVEKGSNKLLGMVVLNDMSINAGAEVGTMNIVSDITMNYSNHNAIEAIVVPEEALQAEEINLEQ